MIPQELRPLFWEIKLETLDPAAYPEYTICRVLEYGDRPAVAWLRGQFSERQIASVVRTTRRLSRRSANFWALIYGIRPANVTALQNPEAGPCGTGK